MRICPFCKSHIVRSLPRSERRWPLTIYAPLRCDVCRLVYTDESPRWVVMFVSLASVLAAGAIVWLRVLPFFLRVSRSALGWRSLFDVLLDVIAAGYCVWVTCVAYQSRYPRILSLPSDQSR